MTAQIIRLTPDRWETYKRIRLQGLLEEPQAFLRSYAEESAFPPERWQQRAANPYSFLALEGDYPLGTMSAFRDESDPSVAYLVGVYVAREARGRGIGSSLLHVLLALLRSDPTIKTVKLTVNREQVGAVSLYEKFGFRIIWEETATMGDGIEHTEYVMGLAL